MRRLKAYGAVRFIWARGIYTALLLIALITSLIKTSTGHCSLPTAVLRPFILIFGLDRLRTLAVSSLMVLPGVADLLLFLTFVVVWFGILGVFIFRDPVLLPTTDESHEYFPSFEEGFVNLFVLTTTANNPDVMMPAYRENRVFYVYFLVFCIVTIFFINNLILASVYEQYRKEIAAQAVEFGKNRRKNFKKAFCILRGPRGTIPKLDMTETLLALRSFWSIRFPSLIKPGNHKDQIIEIIISAMHTNSFVPPLYSPRRSSRTLREYRSPQTPMHIQEHNHHENDVGITWKEFQHLSLVLSLSFRQKTEEETINQGATRWQWLSEVRRKMALMFLSWQYDVAITTVIVAEFVAELVQLEGTHYYTIMGFYFELTFCLLLLFEELFMLSVLGVSRFFHSFRRCFRFVSCLGSAIVEIFVLVYGVNVKILRYVLLLRTLRVFSVLFLVPRFRRVISIIWFLLDPFSVVLGLLMLVLAIFASIGVHMFGGFMFENNPNVLQHAPTFAENRYWALNFNDFPGAYVVVFQLLIVNNWHVIMDGTVAAVGTKWSRVYFIGFYLVVVLVFLNIVVAVMLSISKMNKPTEDSNMLLNQQRQANDINRTHTHSSRSRGSDVSNNMVNRRSRSRDAKSKTFPENSTKPVARKTQNSQNEQDFYLVEAYKQSLNRMSSMYNVFGFRPEYQSSESQESLGDIDSPK
ncbi:hypothetical protein AAMO2058_000533700 [Amorphochlora amoebiformis]